MADMFRKSTFSAPDTSTIVDDHLISELIRGPKSDIVAKNAIVNIEKAIDKTSNQPIFDQLVQNCIYAGHDTDTIQNDSNLSPQKNNNILSQNTHKNIVLSDLNSASRINMQTESDTDIPPKPHGNIQDVPAISPQEGIDHLEGTVFLDNTIQLHQDPQNVIYSSEKNKNIGEATIAPFDISTFIPPKVANPKSKVAITPLSQFEYNPNILTSRTPSPLPTSNYINNTNVDRVLPQTNRVGNILKEIDKLDPAPFAIHDKDRVDDSSRLPLNIPDYRTQTGAFRIESATGNEAISNSHNKHDHIPPLMAGDALLMTLTDLLIPKTTDSSILHIENKVMPVLKSILKFVLDIVLTDIEANNIPADVKANLVSLKYVGVEVASRTIFALYQTEIIELVKQSTNSASIRRRLQFSLTGWLGIRIIYTKFSLPTYTNNISANNIDNDSTLLPRTHYISTTIPTTASNVAGTTSQWINHAGMKRKSSEDGPYSPEYIAINGKQNVEGLQKYNRSDETGPVYRGGNNGTDVQYGTMMRRDRSRPINIGPNLNNYTKSGYTDEPITKIQRGTSQFVHT